MEDSEEQYKFFNLPKPDKLNSIEDIFGSDSTFFTCKNTLEDLLKENVQNFSLEEEIEENIDLNSSFWDWIPLTNIENHEFMCFYYTILIVNANPDSSEYQHVALMFQKEGSEYEIKIMFNNIDSFLAEFKEYEKNKPLLNEEYLEKVKEYENVCVSRLWMQWIRSSFGNYLLSKHRLHEEMFFEDEEDEEIENVQHKLLTGRFLFEEI